MPVGPSTGGAAKSNNAGGSGALIKATESGPKDPGLRKEEKSFTPAPCRGMIGRGANVRGKEKQKCITLESHRKHS